MEEEIERYDFDEYDVIFVKKSVMTSLSTAKIATFETLEMSIET